MTARRMYTLHPKSQPSIEQKEIDAIPDNLAQLQRKANASLSVICDFPPAENKSRTTPSIPILAIC